MDLRRGLIAASVIVGVLGVGGCASAPPRDGLVTKLQERNGLTATQAKCIADGLYDGMPDAQPAIRRLTARELRAVAKPDNAGKVSPEANQIMRDVVDNCVPAQQPPATS